MRTLALVLGLAVLGVTLGGCQQVCSTWQSTKCCVRNAVDSCSDALTPDPCKCQAAPVYPNGCGGDQGVGRGGSGAFARP